MLEFTHSKQLDAMYCRPTSLRMMDKIYGNSFSIHCLRSETFTTKSGVSMLGISDAAERIGFRTRGYHLPWEQLHDEVPLPCIEHWNQRQ